MDTINTNPAPLMDEHYTPFRWTEVDYDTMARFLASDSQENSFPVNAFNTYSQMGVDAEKKLGQFQRADLRSKFMQHKALLDVELIRLGLDPSASCEMNSIGEEFEDVVHPGDTVLLYFLPEPEADKLPFRMFVAPYRY